MYVAHVKVFVLTALLPENCILNWPVVSAERSVVLRSSVKTVFAFRSELHSLMFAPVHCKK